MLEVFDLPLLFVEIFPKALFKLYDTKLMTLHGKCDLIPFVSALGLVSALALWVRADTSPTGWDHIYHVIF